MMFDNKRAGLLERSLQGEETSDQEMQELVATAARICALSSASSSPRDEFVSALGIQLRAEALTLPDRQARRVQPTPVGRSAARPMVFVIGRGLPRILAGAAASVLLVGALVGGVSRSALPGGLLYPVKQLLNSAELQLAGSDFDRGMTLLSQAQEHISDAAALVDRDGAQTDPDSVNEALLSAYDAVSAGQRALIGEFDRTGNTQALIALQDFTVRAVPQLDALQSLVPAQSKPDLNALIALLQGGRSSLARKVAACGQPCATLGDTALGSSPVSAPGNGLFPTQGTGGVLGNGSTINPGGLPTSGGLPAPVPGGVVPGAGGVVVVVEGEHGNLKLTRPDDLELAQALLDGARA